MILYYNPTHSNRRHWQPVRLLRTKIKVINDRYKFLHMDGLNKRSIKEALDKRVLDDKVLIVDEVDDTRTTLAACVGEPAPFQQARRASVHIVSIRAWPSRSQGGEGAFRDDRHHMC